MEILARVFGFSKPEVCNVVEDSHTASSSSSSSSVTPTAARQQRGEGGISIFKRLLADHPFDDNKNKQEQEQTNTLSFEICN